MLYQLSYLGNAGILARRGALTQYQNAPMLIPDAYYGVLGETFKDFAQLFEDGSTGREWE
jgi:hypothetical protein